MYYKISQRFNKTSGPFPSAFSNDIWSTVEDKIMRQVNMAGIVCPGITLTMHFPGVKNPVGNTHGILSHGFRKSVAHYWECTENIYILTKIIVCTPIII